MLKCFKGVSHSKEGRTCLTPSTFKCMCTEKVVVGRWGEGEAILIMCFAWEMCFVTWSIHKPDALLAKDFCWWQILNQGYQTLDLYLTHTAIGLSQQPPSAVLLLLKALGERQEEASEGEEYYGQGADQEVLLRSWERLLSHFQLCHLCRVVTL